MSKIEIRSGREYRALQEFSLEPRENENDAYIVRGTAAVFNTPTCLWECDGIKYYEIIDRHAFDGCEMGDVIFNYNHRGKVVARTRNKTLELLLNPLGLDMRADLSGTAAGRDLYEEIDGKYIDKMSFSFSIRESSYDNETRTRTITKIKRLFDVSAVDFPAYSETSISARGFFELERSKELEALEKAHGRRLLIARLRTH